MRVLTINRNTAYLSPRCWFAIAGLLALTATGCTSFLSPMSGIPVGQIPPEMRGQSRNNLVPVPLSILRQQAPPHYSLDEGDILGIYIEGIMPPKSNENQTETAPPVHFPEAGSDLPPSVGYPIPIRDDGTLPLPLVEPIQVRGKTLTEVEAAIRKAYVVDKKILKEGRDRILVSLMRERTYRVIVIREDEDDSLALPGGSGGGSKGSIVGGSTRSGSGHTLDLPAYKNDVMHALAQTGGLPGLNAKNEVKILKANRIGQLDANGMPIMMPGMAGSYVDSGMIGGGCMPQDPCYSGCNLNQDFDPTAIRIPLRVYPGQMPHLQPSDIILEEGDIVVVEARDTEFFYTGGLLPGGQFPIPRDYDLDVVGAMAIAGQGLGGSGQSQGGGGMLGGGFAGASPTQLYVMRTTPCGDQFNIAVDLNKALNDKSERLMVQPGDTLILRYKPCEELVNFSLVTFFTYGITELFRN
ncbi:Polysaccharide biosynthesis/export protein [Rosistilla carotiformis]|uniref:Polysaccharide biosynthesis/export protein n=1 Tax=Rosistilla carotiformis TaxID=2528017 RepID=A0A518JPH1_9BACT|nr:polysaccharide biosynthesis/export family protein [Rosistilla carotiformis]QDV67450.1 Polysaccharide biosynthesis/export protein [Rosistilla carotiformis]